MPLHMDQVEFDRSCGENVGADGKMAASEGGQQCWTEHVEDTMRNSIAGGPVILWVAYSGVIYISESSWIKWFHVTNA